MSVKSGLFTIYTLTPTHCGTGQASGAVDLPIARERHTDLPILPATTLKGVAREAFENDTGANSGYVKNLFGPEIRSGGVGEEHRAGALVFCEAKLIAYPARSLNKPFFFATSRLALERLERDLRAFGFVDLATKIKIPQKSTDALVADKDLAGKPLVVEDIVYEGSEVKAAGEVGALAELIAGWLPAIESGTAQRLSKSLLVLPDDDFLSLVHRAVPVQARIQLTSGKTTDAYKGAHGEEKGNLWYEEALPADCLFAMFITERVQRRPDTKDAPGNATTEWKEFWDKRGVLASVQIGGNETVGYGRCWWNAVQEGVTK